MAFEIARVVVIVALLGIAAAITTPKGKLPLALRGVYKIIKKDLNVKPLVATAVKTTNSSVSTWKRLLALIMVLASIVIAMI